jgi:polysaccharide biosynthesis transport protein
MDVLSRRARIDYADDGAAKEASVAEPMSAIIEQLTGFIRRQYQVFVIVPAAAIAVGLLYLLITPAQSRRQRC